MARSTVPTHKPVAILTRVSEQGDRSDEGLRSHEIQSKKARRYLENNDLPVSTEEFKDNNRSGGKMTRPALDRALDGCRSGKLGGIAVYHLSRLGRTTRGVLDVIYELEDLGCTFVCLTPRIDTSTPEGRAMLTVFLAFYTLEREQAVVKAADTRELKLEEGRTTGGRAPVGYEWEVTGTDSRGKPILGWLVPSADFEAVKAVRLAFAKGKIPTAGKVADALNEAGVRTTRGGEWNRQNVVHFLRNGRYAGEAEGNRKHEAMHDAGTQRVIERRVAPRSVGRPRTVGEGHLLGQGLLRCPCGRCLTRSIAAGKYPVLKCGGRGKGHAVISYGLAEEWIVSSAFIHGVSVDGYAEKLVGLRNREQLVARVTEARAEVERLEAEIGVALPAASAPAQALAVAEDALHTFDAEAEEDDSPAVMNRAQFDALESLADRVKALRSIVSEVVISPGVKGSRKQDLMSRVVIHFHDGTQYPALPNGAEVEIALASMESAPVALHQAEHAVPVEEIA